MRVNMDKKKNTNKYFRRAIYVLAALAVFMMLWPLVLMLRDAAAVFFRGWSVLPDIGRSLLTTLSVLLLVLLIALPCGFGMALWMYVHDHLKAVRRLRELFTILAWLPSVMLGLIARSLLVPYLGDGRLAMIVLLAMFVMPFLVIRFEQALQSVPPSIRRAGLILGATPMAVVWNLVLPKAVWELLRCCVMCVERILGEATALLMLFSAVPAGSMLSIELFRLAWIGRGDAIVLALLLAGCLVILRLATARRWDGQMQEKHSGLKWHRD